MDTGSEHMTTPSDVAARVLELDERATDGPWKAHDKKTTGDVRSPKGTTKMFKDGTRMSVCSTWGDDGQHMSDAELIAYYRTAAPLLARSVVGMQAREDAFVAALREVADYEDVSVTVVGCNLLYAIQAAVRLSALEMGLPDDPYERVFRAVRAVFAARKEST